MYIFVLVFLTELRKLLISSPYLTIPMETWNMIVRMKDLKFLGILIVVEVAVVVVVQVL